MDTVCLSSIIFERLCQEIEGCRKCRILFWVSKLVILLMEEILHHLGFINLVNNGIIYISTGAGSLPSTV